MVNFTVIIPARLASSRLPEKLLKTIGNQTVLEHSYLAAQKSHATRVIIATDEKKIQQHANSFGAQAILTGKNHESGTDRLAECVHILDLPDDEIIINLQGDEPFMPSTHIDLCADTLANNQSTAVATLATPLTHWDELNNPNVVKVVINQLGQALYFSRAGIPFNRDLIDLTISQHYFHHLGIYGYRSGFLKQYHQLAKSQLEQIEKLEQLRILDNGFSIAVAVVKNKPPKGIDTLADLQQAEHYYQQLCLKQQNKN